MDDNKLVQERLEHSADMKKMGNWIVVLICIIILIVVLTSNGNNLEPFDRRP